MMGHTDVKSFAWSICEYKYKKETNLKRHMVTHTGLNLFLCTVCGKCYTGNKQLQNHLKILEHGELLCTQCGYLTFGL